MDVRIGVSQTAKELDVELPDGADADAVKADIDKALADGGVALAHRQEGPPGRRPGREDRLHRDRPPRRRPPHRLRRLTPRSGPACHWSRRGSPPAHRVGHPP